MSRSMSFVRMASDQLSKSALTSDGVEAIASSTPVTATRPATRRGGDSLQHALSSGKVNGHDVFLMINSARL
jgi:hypothetical protein